jgi:hypothetical protein
MRTVAKRVPRALIGRVVIVGVGVWQQTSATWRRGNLRQPVQVIILFRRRHPRRTALLIGNLANNVLSIIPAAIKQKMSFF